MDAVLDTLLQTLFHIVPYEMASVILTEENERLFVAREAPPASANRPVVTLEVGDNALLQRVLVLKKGLHLADTREEPDWREHKALAGVRSWIAVPLVASDTVQLSEGATCDVPGGGATGGHPARTGKQPIRSSLR